MPIFFFEDKAASDLYIDEKVNGNKYKIAGGITDIEVSWQVTRIRQGPFANNYG